jgi:hypothetical protein
MSSKEERFNQVWDDVTSIATEDEMRLVCSINGTNVESLESIIHVRTTYSTYDQWVEMEESDVEPTNKYICGSCGDSCNEYTYNSVTDVDECNDCKAKNVIAGVDFSDSINQLNQL